ncbi:unnamed protein product [Amaranthus hypochondriacus]
MDYQTINFSSFFTLINLIFIIFLSSLYFTLHSLIISKKQTFGFKSYPFIGTIPEFIANRHRFLEWTTEILSSNPFHTSIYTRPGNVYGIMTAYPPNLEHFLKTRFDNYDKGPRYVSLLHDLLGSGIFNCDGDLWKLQRKTAILEFNTRSLKNFILDCIRSEITTRLIPVLNEASDSGRVLDLQDILDRFAFDNVCKLAFGFDPDCLFGRGSEESEFMRAFEVATKLSAGRFLYVLPITWMIKKWLNVGSEKKLRESVKIVHEFADKIIRSRINQISSDPKNSNLNNQDLLSRFICSDEIETKDPNFLRDVVISFILAGKDSTSSVLSWLFWLLSVHSDILSKIRFEVHKVRVRAGKQVGDTYNFEELREMNYLHGALSEVLRLYPSVPLDTRTCLKDDVLPDGTKIKKDWFITYSSYAMGRIESIWGKDCLEFRPERWIDENGLYKPVDPFKYPAFNGGPRTCLGKEMSYLQMKSIVACMVEQFDFDVVGKEKSPQYLLSLTLRVRNGLQVKVKAR